MLLSQRQENNVDCLIELNFKKVPTEQKSDYNTL